jgi:hypothetical protein
MSEVKTLHDKLIDIQQNLKVPKTRENDFGGFSYRNVEDIEIALKPFLKKHNLLFYFSDQVKAVGDRVYLVATACLSDGENIISGEGWAREAEKPKAKTDDAQLTGGCSSYARKYAAQGLFLIDDGKSDPDNPAHETAQAMGVGELNIARQKLFTKFKEKGISDSDVMMEKINKATGKDLVETVGDVAKVIKLLDESN